MVTLGNKSLEPTSVRNLSVIDVVGDIDFKEMMRIKNVIGALIERQNTHVVLNLKAVDHINYMSLGVLLERLRLLRNLNGDLKLVGISSYVMDIFKFVGVDHLFETYGSIEDAIESFDDDWRGGGTYH